MGSTSDEPPGYNDSHIRAVFATTTPFLVFAMVFWALRIYSRLKPPRFTWEDAIITLAMVSNFSYKLQLKRSLLSLFHSIKLIHYS
jgi:hypothetical protein